jgi:methylphosphotriester-DNA--protein-cysteine methyltransferase
MYQHTILTASDLFRKLKNRRIQYAGNKRLKIFGRLNCKSGKRMKKENRVFFKTEAEALSSGFRPCGHCMRLDQANGLKNNHLKFSKTL